MPNQIDNEITTMDDNRKRHIILFYNFEKSNYFSNNFIIDTPGTDFDEEYDENIFQYYNKADIVILVLTASTQIKKSMLKFYEKFGKQWSKLHFYVVFNWDNVYQSRHDWQEGLEESITTLTKIFPTASNKKMEFIISLDQMEVITKSKYDSGKNETFIIRDDSFLNLRDQLKKKRVLISMVRRHGYISEILEIMNKHQLYFLQKRDKQNGIHVSLYYKTMTERNENYSTTVKQSIENVLGTIENGRRKEMEERKVKTDVIDYIERNNTDYKVSLTELAFTVMGGTFFMGAAIIVMPINGINMGGIIGRVDSIVGNFLENNKFEDYLEKFGEGLFPSFSNFQQQTSKFANLAKRKLQINNQIDKFSKKMYSFKQNIRYHPMNNPQ